jgi:hypothetical protein
MADFRFLSMSPAEREEVVRFGMERFDRASVELAEQGWSVPMSLTPAETYEMLEAGTPAEIDARFVRLYDADEGRHFERLAEDLLNRDGLAHWRVLLEQTVSAYRRREFAITIPALLTVCEGVLMHGEGNRTDLRAVVRERVETEQHKSPESIDIILWHNVHRFVDELFKRSDFSSARPRRLNRHWILHGRDAPTWNQADCLRLLQAVDTISMLRDDGAVQ